MRDTGNETRNVIAYANHQGKGDTFIQNNDGGKPKKSFVEILQSLIAFLLFSTIFVLVVCAVFGTGYVMGETSARRSVASDALLPARGARQVAHVRALSRKDRRA